MNRLATKSHARHKTPRLVAKLDTSSAPQRQLQSFFLRMHRGHSPALRVLTLRQLPDQSLVEAAQWLRKKSHRYSVITWTADQGGLSWSCQPMPSRRAAIEAVRAMGEPGATRDGQR